MNNKTISSVVFSHIGKRLNHEDNYLMNGIYLTSASQKQMPDNRWCCFRDTALPYVSLYAISDGMGGHNAGEVASRICVEKIASTYEDLQRYPSIKDAVACLQTTIADINKTVCELSRTDCDLKGMGATLVLFVTCGNECAVLNIGDSRAYHFSGNKLIQITKDNTEGQRMLDLGLLTRKELLNFPARKNLNRYIGFQQNGYILQADEYYPNIDGGMIVLCSDGISDFVSDEQIAEILCSEQDPAVAGKQISDKAVACQNADNATIILIPQ